MSGGPEERSLEAPVVAHFDISSQQAVLQLRHHVRELAARCGLGLAARARIVMGVTELAENVLKHAGSGWCEMGVVHGGECGDRLDIIIEDHGHGIRYLPEVLGERLDAEINRLGSGLPGVRRLSDQFDISSDDRGTRIWLSFLLPEASGS